MAGNTPIGNLQLSAATYFTGSSFIQLQKVNILQLYKYVKLTTGLFLNTAYVPFM